MRIKPLLNNQWFVAAMAIAALLTGLSVQQRLVQKSEAKPPLPVAVAFTLPDSSGRLRHSREWLGKVVIVNFWATWCPPCLKEIPEFIQLQQEMGERGLQFIGIALDGFEEVKEYTKTTAVNYPLLIAPDEGVALSAELGNHLGVVPYSVVIDRDGTIVHTQHGVFSTKQILKVIEPLL